MIDHAEDLLRNWCHRDGLTALHITAEFDDRDYPLRLWWFFSGYLRISPSEGMCDEASMAFLELRHKLSIVDRLLFDQQPK